MNYHPHTLFDNYGHETVVSVCDTCGCVITDAVRHSTVCDVVKPVRPEPVPIDRHEWANLLHAHRADVFDGRLVCHCGFQPANGDTFKHAQHVAAKLANHVEAQR